MSFTLQKQQLTKLLLLMDMEHMEFLMPFGTVEKVMTSFLRVKVRNMIQPTLEETETTNFMAHKVQCVVAQTHATLPDTLGRVVKI